MNQRLLKTAAQASEEARAIVTAANGGVPITDYNEYLNKTGRVPTEASNRTVKEVYAEKFGENGSALGPTNAPPDVAADGEVRTTSKTGGTKGMKPERMDLVPVEPLRTVARVYGWGARKYDKHGECNCYVNAVSPPMPEACAEAATTRTSSSEIQSTRSGSVASLPPGTNGTQDTRTQEVRSPSTVGTTTNSPLGRQLNCSNEGATFVAATPTSASTTTTHAVQGQEPVVTASEDASAIGATSGSATTKDGLPSMGKEHSSTCASRQVVSAGDHNWRRGYEWSKSYAAAMRHLTAFWGGEDNDPESGESHLAHVVFHMMAMMEWSATHPEYDDRYRPASQALERSHPR